MAVNIQVINKSFQDALNLQSRGKYRASIESLRKIVKTIPNHFPSWNALGAAYVEENHLQEAHACLRESLKWCPEFYPASINIAKLFINSGQLDEAKAILQDLLNKNPGLPIAHLLMHHVHSKNFAFPEARDSLDEFIKLQDQENEDPSAARVPLLDYQIKRDLDLPPFMASISAESEILKHLESALSKWEVSSAVGEGIPLNLTSGVFHLAYYGGDPRSYLERISKIYLKHFPELAWTSPHCQQPKPKGKDKIKIGVVSAYLDKFHAIGFAYGPLIKGLSEDFSITYFRAPSEDKSLASVNLRERLGKVRCVDLSPSVKESREIIADQKMDVLWYSDINMSTFNYFLAHARLAPVQCVSGGHPCTTGIGTLDYFISSALLEVPGASDRYTEKVVELATFPVLYEDFPPLELPLNRKMFGLPEGKRLYFCAQTLFKNHPSMDSIYKGILEGDPEAVIVFSYAGTHLASVLEARLRESLGELSERCQFINVVTQHQFFYLLSHFDVILDTHPFAGGNTVCQAFSVGVPTVTLVPKDLRGAAAWGIYGMMGIEDCIAENRDDYARKCVKIARDTATRDGIVKKIKDNKRLIFNQGDRVLQSYRELFLNLCDASLEK